MTENKTLKKLDYPHKITLYKNGNNPSIYYYFTWKNKVYRGSTSETDLSSSINKVVEIFFEVKKGLRNKVKQEKPIYFEDVLKKFFQYKQDEGISPDTLKEYKRKSKYLLERFKGREISSICSKTEYRQYQEWRKQYYSTHETKQRQSYKKNGKVIKGRFFNNVGVVPINRELRLFVSILRYSKEYMDCLKGIDIPSYSLLKERRREPILEKPDYLKLKNYWTKKNPYYWMIISFVNSTGIRYPSELLKIQWKHVHLDKSYLWIVNRKSKDKTQSLDTPIPLVGRTREIIETLKNRPDISTKPEDFVFVNDKGKVIKNIRKSFNKSLEECGIDSNICMYSLRHLFTTRMVRRPDIPVKVLSTVLGHKDTTMVDRQYSHLKTEHIVSVFQRSEDKKQEILNGQRQSQSKNNHKTP